MIQTQAQAMEAIKAKTQTVPWRGILALFGGFLIQLTLGSFYSFGNMMTYLTSYMRQHGSPDLTYADFIVVQSVWGMTQGLIMPLSGYISRWTGPRAAMLLGCLIFSIGAAATRWTLDMGLAWVAFTYGFVSALGQGIALIPTMTIGMRWFPNNKGMAMGIVVGGFGGGAFVFNQIQTAILNPDNLSPQGEFFTNTELLDKVPNLMLILGGLYFSIQIFACFLVTEPQPDPELLPAPGHQEEEAEDMGDKILMDEETGESYVTPREALRRRELYMLWLTRFSVVLITQSVSGFYKAFGQTFIHDDHFLSFVGAVSSVFNCSGRLFYGVLMDRSTYKVSMLLETVLLTLLVSTLPLTMAMGRVGFMIWIWAIYFTFPGTYSTQPAVTTQTFGHKHGGTIYGFLFTSDIINNLLVGALSRTVLGSGGWVGFFLVLATFGLLAFLITCFFPASPEPGPRPLKTEVEIEAGPDAITNHNIVKTATGKKLLKEVEEEVIGEEEDASKDQTDDEHQACLSKKS